MGIINKIDRIKRRLFKKPFIKDKRYPAYWFDRALGKQTAFLVQIGSNDGKTGDPLFPLLEKNTRWKGLFVEPVPYAFERLEANYPDASRFTCANVAINNGEQLTFYWVDPAAKDTMPDLPYWYDQLGSFDKQHILKHFEGKLEPFIISKKLEGITLENLLNRHQVEKIDVLHIDTEGFDWNILSQLNLEKYQPGFILYEQNHLSPSDLQASIDFLNPLYTLFKSGIDMLAVRKDINATFYNDMSKNGWESINP